MERKQRLFIYDRKEMGVLLLLGVFVAFFAFTLGVHLGKRVTPRPIANANAPAEPVVTVPDQVPHRQELQDQIKNTTAAVDESLSQALHEEVSRTGIKLDVPRQVNLPDQAKLGRALKGDAPSSIPQLDTIDAFKRPAPHGEFTLQIGSYTSIQEAKDQVDAIEALGLKPHLRVADVRGKGKWFRVYLGGYDTKGQAEAAGDRFVGQHVVDSFMITKLN